MATVDHGSGSEYEAKDAVGGDVDGDDDVDADVNDDLNDDVDDDWAIAQCEDDPEAAVDSGLVEGDEVVTVGNTYTDENGHIRIGQQPLAKHLRIDSIPLEQSTKVIQRKVIKSFSAVDRKLSGLAAKAMTHLRKELGDTLQRTLETGKDNLKTRLCDYTGTVLLWTSGPRNFSVEAIYPLALSATGVAYHKTPNVAAIHIALNLVKRRHGPLALPLVAAWCRVFDNEAMGFQEKKKRWAWLYNAATNASHISRFFHMDVAHKCQEEVWSRLSPDAIRAFLETARTGTWSAASGEAATQLWDDGKLDKVIPLFVTNRDKSDTRWDWEKNCWLRCNKIQKQHGREIYRQLLRIAHRFGVIDLASVSKSLTSCVQFQP